MRRKLLQERVWQKVVADIKSFHQILQNLELGITRMVTSEVTSVSSDLKPDFII